MKMSINQVTEIDGPVVVRSVLASVSDKTDLDVLVKGLVEINPEVTIYSTGGTAGKIEEILGADAPANLTKVSAYTGQPEMQGGLVKTLDFKIYLGLLSETYNDAHQADLARTEAVPIDLVVVNLYPFRETVAAADCTPEKARGNTDIGGPCMLRSAAKNYLRVASVVDPADYAALLQEMRDNGGAMSLRTRFDMMRKAFAHTAQYDTDINTFWQGKTFEEAIAGYKVHEAVKRPLGVD